ncbi:Hypothetical predicted protein [Mytilus galloprovincialis]|uniref:Reverse transcriptase domain-containing protein n=1 Tax=Mytilus galloprovincialis TaxID=29158 RepID=A0A8B6HSN6_MYTGA|nr:Hypothetical predicted protein [Mytilus galloprovincialis]
MSPLFCALLLNDVIIDAVYRKSPFYVALLDAKSAFDVVKHSRLYRKLYLAGISGSLWLLLHDLSVGAQTSVRWENLVSEPFDIKQGVRQGRILSTELYKLYINDVLNQLEDSALGSYIGHIHCPIPTCANDVTLVVNDHTNMQTLLSTVIRRSIHYSLQNVKLLKLGNQ